MPSAQPGRPHHPLSGRRVPNIMHPKIVMVWGTITGTVFMGGRDNGPGHDDVVDMHIRSCSVNRMLALVWWCSPMV